MTTCQSPPPPVRAGVRGVDGEGVEWRRGTDVARPVGSPVHRVLESDDM